MNLARLSDLVKKATAATSRMVHLLWFRPARIGRQQLRFRGATNLAVVGAAPLLRSPARPRAFGVAMFPRGMMMSKRPGETAAGVSVIARSGARETQQISTYRAGDETALATESTRRDPASPGFSQIPGVERDRAAVYSLDTFAASSPSRVVTEPAV